MDEKELLNKLLSTEDNIVTEAIAEIAKKGNPKLLETLLNIYSKSNNIEISKSTIGLLNNLHDQNCVDVIIDFLNNCSDSDKKNQVVSSCWQSSLNYSKHITLFVDIFIKGDLATAIEAFSVIDNCIDQITKEEGDSIIKLIADNFNSLSVEKQGLANSIIDSLK